MKVTKNFWKVLNFELMRSLKKPTFWIATLIIPLALVAYIGLSAFAGYSASSAFEAETSTTDMRIGLTDASGYLDQNSSKNFKNANDDNQSVNYYETLEAGKAALEKQEIDLYYYLPASFTTDPTAEVYVKPAQISVFSDYSSPLKTLLASSAYSHVAPVDLAIITNTVSYQTTTLDADNQVVDPTAAISRIGVPLLGLVFFYILIAVFGNRLTVAMVEEKENRISEMILATARPDDIILGKVVSLMVLGFVQLFAMLIPVLIFFATGLSKNLLPLELNIALTPENLTTTFLLLIFSYFLFTALCVTISTLTPTAKDASSFSAFIVILVILPLILIDQFVSSTPNTIVYFLSYFPPSAPIALMLRNIFDTLPSWEFWLSIVYIAVCGLAVFALAVHFYRLYAIEFTARIDLKKLLNRPRKSWKN